jgi:hypothetical protein
VAQDDNVALNKRVVRNARVECSVQYDSYGWQRRRILNYHQESALYVRTAPTNGRRSPVGSHHIEVRLADREVFVRLVLLDRPVRPDASLPCRPTARQWGIIERLLSRTDSDRSPAESRLPGCAISSTSHPTCTRRYLKSIAVPRADRSGTS